MGDGGVEILWGDWPVGWLHCMQINFLLGTAQLSATVTENKATDRFDKYSKAYTILPPTVVLALEILSL